MKGAPKVIVLRTAGTNCDREAAFAFETCGARVRLVHVNQLVDKQVPLCDFHILVIPGGFTYGDDIESGRLLANELRLRLGDDLCRFIGDGKLVIGICNGFQVMVKAGILPGPLDDGEQKQRVAGQRATLINNDSGKFEDRWCYLRAVGKSVWTEGLEEIVYFPVAHAEGKFVPKDDAVLDLLKKNGQVAFRYCTEKGDAPVYPQNPNGSVDDIAGITDVTGRILGIMPHPERHFLFTQHPFWTRIKLNGRFGHGARIFENGVNYVEKNLL
jgi:phosphoribosylformylglycinamidine synthase